MKPKPQSNHPFYAPRARRRALWQTVAITGELIALAILLTLIALIAA